MATDFLEESMRCHLYKVGRRQKDFEYVLPEVIVRGYVEDLPWQGTWQGKQLEALKSYAKARESKDLMVVCEPQNMETHTRLEGFGLAYGSDWLWGEDCFSILDRNTWAGQHRGKPVWIWGTGQMAELVWERTSDFYAIQGFLDNHKNKEELHGLPVLSPQQCQEWRSKRIIVATYQYEPVREQLLSFGLGEVEDFIFFKLALPVSGYMLEAWRDDASYGLECYSMLNNLDYSAGDCYPCCTTFMVTDIGSTLFQSFDQIWNGKLHRILCMTTLNRTYTFCRKDICPALVNKMPTACKEAYTEHRYPEIRKHPQVSNLCFDYSCNLYCESCRSHTLVAQGRDRDKIEKFKETALREIVPYVDFLTMAGNGEVFLSCAYREIWSGDASKNCRYFQILSNGNLLTEDKWRALTENRKSELLCCISIDAATESTYKKLRRGGDWKQLQKNMEFLSARRKEGKLHYLRMNFVVQRANYKEMPGFVAWAKRLGADRVLFTKILNWGTYTADEFNEISMVDANGMPNQEMQEVLKDSLCHDEIVDIGTFLGEHKYRDTDFVGSYYLWEIDNYSGLHVSENILCRCNDNGVKNSCHE